MALAGAVVPASAYAAGASGGATYTPEPELASVACVKNCASRQRIQGGSAVRISGRNLGAVTKVVFQGSGSRTDDKSAAVRSRAPRSVVVAVPFDAQTGPVKAVASGGVASQPTRPVRILPPPPPESQPALSPAPGPRDAGAPAIETATSAGRWFYGAQRGVVFSYRVGGEAPTEVTIDVVRQSDGAVVQTWKQTGVAPGEVRTVRWTGMAGGTLQPEGRYAFRATVQSGAVSARSADAGDPGRDAFDFYHHFFPVRAAHDYGEAGARFGAGRSGHSHQGQDVMASCGSRLVAAQGGTVKHAAYHSAAGYYIVIRTLSGEDHGYMHMTGPSPFQQGDRVFTGQQIGQVGTTGSSSACHLHFEIWTQPGWYDGGRAIDPLPALQAWDRVS